LTQASLEEQRLRKVEGAFTSLPERYLGADDGFRASYRIELDDLGLSWAVELDESRCEVMGSPHPDPDVVIGSDAATWLEGTSTWQPPSRVSSSSRTAARRSFASTR
jgi:hypothetical protein